MNSVTSGTWLLDYTNSVYGKDVTRDLCPLQVRTGVLMKIMRLNLPVVVRICNFGDYLTKQCEKQNHLMSISQLWKYFWRVLLFYLIHCFWVFHVTFFFHPKLAVTITTKTNKKIVKWVQPLWALSLLIQQC